MDALLLPELRLVVAEYTDRQTDIDKQSHGKAACEMITDCTVQCIAAVPEVPCIYMI